MKVNFTPEKFLTAEFDNQLSVGDLVNGAACELHDFMTAHAKTKKLSPMFEAFVDGTDDLALEKACNKLVKDAKKEYAKAHARVAKLLVTQFKL